jgi:hypothetical protein
LVGFHRTTRPYIPEDRTLLYFLVFKHLFRWFPKTKVKMHKWNRPKNKTKDPISLSSDAIDPMVVLFCPIRCAVCPTDSVNTGLEVLLSQNTSLRSPSAFCTTNCYWIYTVSSNIISWRHWRENSGLRDVNCLGRS